ncbi:MAG: ATP-dependent DNA helicase RecG [Acidimicrobiales bacterium]
MVAGSPCIRTSSEWSSGIGGQSAAMRSLMLLARTPIAVLSGVGDKYSASLASVGIESVLDLLTCYPYRYEDRRRFSEIASLSSGDAAWIHGRIADIKGYRSRRGKAMVEADVEDATGSMKVVFFNQPWRAKQLRAGENIWLFGEVGNSRYSQVTQMVNPTVDTAREPVQAGLIPVYPASEKASITSSDIMRFLDEALARAGELADPLGQSWLDRLGVPDRTNALRLIHRPNSPRDIVIARRRLAFDELLWLQVHLVATDIRRRKSSIGIRHNISGLAGLAGVSGLGSSSGVSGPDGPGKPSGLHGANGPDEFALHGDEENTTGNGGGGDSGGCLLDAFFRSLPFELTGSQVKAIEEIAADMAGPLPMHRLLQGDVGSGKTIVAVAALLIGVQGGYQSALMAPTEVLAEQHFLSLQKLVANMYVTDDSVIGGIRPIEVQLLTGRLSRSARIDIASRIGSGHADIVVGTHALLSEAVSFFNLGVIVVDEQHRFGVEQRLSMRGKGGDAGGRDPDVLVMTATPIPRTAALAVFGDLDHTELDEMPKGRSPIKTIWVKSQQQEAKVWDAVRSEVSAGHKGYIVCPLIEDNERQASVSATREMERLANGPLKGLALGIIHGALPALQKAEAMEKFRAGRTQVLVATTVIEVGVDVPDATVMVIEGADRFGLAQLHQLRGRVGRSDLPSYCYLLAEPSTKDGIRRLEAVTATTDGFELAEADMDIRGEGAVLGTRQAGRSGFKLATLRRVDAEEVERARDLAVELVGNDPELSSNPLLRDEVAMFISESGHYLVSG